MTDTYEYIVLKGLMTNPAKEWEVKELYEIIKDGIGWDEYLKTLDDFHRKEYTDPYNSEEKISKIGMNQFNKLKSQYETSLSDKKTEVRFKYANLILIIIFGISTAILGWMTFNKNNKIESLNKEIETLNNSNNKKDKLIDSLTKVIKNLNNNKNK